MSWPRGFSRWPTIRRFSDRYELRLRRQELLHVDSHASSEEARGEEHRFFDLHDAEEFFLGLMQDQFAAQALRDFAIDDLRPSHVWSASRFSDFEVARALAWLAVEEKAFRVVRFHDPLPFLRLPEEPEEAPPPPPIAPEPKQSWVGIQVVWDDTGEPVAGVPLVVEAAGNVGAGRSMRETGVDGVARFEVPPGLCEARCSFKDLTAAECAAAAGGVGAGGPAPAAAPAQSEGGAPRPRPKAIVRVESRKVRSGETPESVAREAGLTWQELAHFNYGTKKPEEINEHLAAEVGCTKKTADGKNYVFDDGDRPGTIVVPRQWRMQGLAPGRVHEVRVRPARAFSGPAGVQFLRVKLLADGEPRSPKNYVLKLDDGSERPGRTGSDGVLVEKVPSTARTATIRIEGDLGPEEYVLQFVARFEPGIGGVQQRLRNAGLLRSASGQVDEQTKTALARFQERHQLSVTGDLDADTQAKLEEVHGS